jgi:putative transposase
VAGRDRADLSDLLRNSFKYASKADWGQISKDLKPVYTAPSEQAALDAFAEFGGTWERKYPAIVRLWTNAWPEFVPFLRFDTEIRKIVCSTNNRVPQRPLPACGQCPRHFPTEQAAMKVLYLAVTSLDPTGKGRARWSNRWTAALNAFDIAFDGRISAARR